MKRKLLCLSLVMLCLICTALAQKPRIYIAPFKYDGKDIRQLLPQFRSAVLSGVNKANRLDIIESMEDKVMPNDSIYKAAHAQQADYILQCELFNHNLTDAVNLITSIANAVENKSGSVSDNLSYNVKLIRVKDEVVINSSKMSNNGSAYSSSSSTTNALDNATKNVLYWVGEQMKRYIEYHFPLEARIVEMEEVKRDRVQSVYINLGTNSQVNEKTIFLVYEIKKVANELIRDEIGQLRVDKINGENVSLCKVQKGAKEIYDAIQKGKELLLISTVK